MTCELTISYVLLHTCWNLSPLPLLDVINLNFLSNLKITIIFETTGTLIYSKKQNPQQQIIMMILRSHFNPPGQYGRAFKVNQLVWTGLTIRQQGTTSRDPSQFEIILTYLILTLHY